MGYRKKTSQNKLSNLLPALSQDQGWERQLDLHSIFPRWKEIVGEEMASYAQPLKIDRGVLWVEVSNSSWLQQLQYEKLELLDSLNSCFRLARLNDIKMVLPKRKDQVPEKKSGPAIQFVRPSEEKVAAFQRQVDSVADEKCREALMQFWYLAQACQRKKE